jgi:hypothetical protein
MNHSRCIYETERSTCEQLDHVSQVATKKAQLVY